MKIGSQTLRALLEHNVLEIKFKRRTVKPGAPPTRRMLCTNSPVILLSDAGRTTLKYESSTNNLTYNPTAKNLVIAWDILKQDYRAISVDNCELISQMPVTGDGIDFWEYFNESIYPMSPGEKETFFNV
jgi:hypothetical protein